LILFLLLSYASVSKPVCKKKHAGNAFVCIFLFIMPAPISDAMVAEAKGELRATGRRWRQLVALKHRRRRYVLEADQRVQLAVWKLRKRRARKAALDEITLAGPLVCTLQAAAVEIYWQRRVVDLHVALSNVLWAKYLRVYSQVAYVVNLLQQRRTAVSALEQARKRGVVL
jgi:hypothetical protein